MRHPIETILEIVAVGTGAVLAAAATAVAFLPGVTAIGVGLHSLHGMATGNGRGGRGAAAALALATAFTTVAGDHYFSTKETTVGDTYDFIVHDLPKKSLRKEAESVAYDFGKANWRWAGGVWELTAGTLSGLWKSSTEHVKKTDTWQDAQQHMPQLNQP